MAGETPEGLVQQARQLVARLDGRWFANHTEVVIFAQVLANASILQSPKATIEYFAEPWKWERYHRIWVHSGQPAVGTTKWAVLVKLLGACEHGLAPLVRLSSDS